MTGIKNKPFEKRLFFFFFNHLLRLEKTEEAKNVSVNSAYLFMEDGARWNSINFRKTTIIYEIASCTRNNVSLNKLLELS